MEKRVYSLRSLEASLDQLEEKYGRSSEEVYAIASRGERVEGVPGFDRSVWTSIYRDVCRMREDDFSASISRTLERA